MEDKTTKAEDEQEGITSEAPVPAEGDKKEGLTQADVDKAIESRLARAKATAEKEKQEAVTKAVKEAERLSALSQDEKQKELSAKMQEELQLKERELTIRENKLIATARLEDSKIPKASKFVEMLVDVDPEKMNEKIESFVEIWNESQKVGIEQHIAGKPPKDLGKDNSNAKPAEVVTAF